MLIGCICTTCHVWFYQSRINLPDGWRTSDLQTESEMCSEIIRGQQRLSVPRVWITLALFWSLVRWHYFFCQDMCRECLGAECRGQDSDTYLAHSGMQRATLQQAHTHTHMQQDTCLLLIPLWNTLFFLFPTASVSPPAPPTTTLPTLCNLSAYDPPHVSYDGKTRVLSPTFSLYGLKANIEALIASALVRVSTAHSLSLQK